MSSVSRRLIEKMKLVVGRPLPPGVDEESAGRLEEGS